MAVDSIEFVEALHLFITDSLEPQLRERGFAHFVLFLGKLRRLGAVRSSFIMLKIALIVRLVVFQSEVGPWIHRALFIFLVKVFIFSNGWLRIVGEQALDI